MGKTPARVGYVLKMYPRFSETFIVSEILAHERAGLDIEIFSLRPPVDSDVHENIARVRAPLTYIPVVKPDKAQLDFELQAARGFAPQFAPTPDPAYSERDLYQALMLARAARARGITHLHAHFGSAATTVARLAAGAANLSFSFTAHAKDIFHESVQAHDMRNKLRDAAAVITVSDFNVEYMRGTYGGDAGKVRRIYNGLDLEAFAYTPPTHRAPKIISVGRLVEKKGMSDLIAACAILRERGRAFECAIVGAGPLEENLRSQIAYLGLGSRVALLGPRTQEEVKRMIKEAAVFAAPCIIGADGNRDGLPTVLLEAMALGTPCVSTDVTGIPEVLHHGQTGLIVNQHDAQALAGAIERLLDDRELAVQMAGNARRLLETNFDIHQNTTKIRSVFSQAWTDRISAAP